MDGAEKVQYANKIVELQATVDIQNGIIADQANYINVLKKEIWKRHADVTFSWSPPAPPYS